MDNATASGAAWNVSPLMDIGSGRFVSLLTRDTLALVLAGARGERLEHLTLWRPLPAMPFGGKFRLIDFALSNCVNSGVRRIGVITQYKSHSLIRHVHKGWGFLRGDFGEFIEVHPASQRVETSWYSGTADAVYQNLDTIRVQRPKYVLILAADQVYRMDYGPMLARHVESGADLTVACVKVPLPEARHLGVMRVDDEGQVRYFEEKPASPEAAAGGADMAIASMGIYVVNADFLYDQVIKDADTASSAHDFGRDVIPKAIEDFHVEAYPFEKSFRGERPYWRDVGTVDTYWEANMDLVSVTPELNLYDTDWPIWTYEEHLPPAMFLLGEDGQPGMAVDSVVAGGCVVAGATVRRTVLFTDVNVDRRSIVEDSVVLPEVQIGPDCHITKAVIDRLCKIPAGTVIGADLDADARRFQVTEGGVVVVTPEMLGDDIHRFR